MKSISKSIVLTTIGVALLGVVASASATSLRANLDGFQRVPSISTDASGRFRANLSLQQGEVRYQLSYQNVGTPVRFAHIHLGRRARTGGIMVWLCDSVGASPTPAPACPQGGGTVSGTLTASMVQAIDSQGLAAGDFEAFVDALLNGAGYVNVHTDAFPAGEFRGQVRLGAGF